MRIGLISDSTSTINSLKRYFIIVHNIDLIPINDYKIYAAEYDLIIFDFYDINNEASMEIFFLKFLKYNSNNLLPEFLFIKSPLYCETNYGFTKNIHDIKQTNKPLTIINFLQNFRALKADFQNNYSIDYKSFFRAIDKTLIQMHIKHHYDKLGLKLAAYEYKPNKERFLNNINDTLDSFQKAVEFIDEIIPESHELEEIIITVNRINEKVKLNQDFSRIFDTLNMMNHSFYHLLKKWDLI